MRQPDADTNGRNLRRVLAPTWGLPSETVRDLAPGLREEPRRGTAESLDVRNLPSSYRSASNSGDSALP